MSKIISKGMVDIYNKFYNRDEVLNDSMVGLKLKDLQNGYAFTNIINMIYEIDRTINHSRRKASLVSIFGSYDNSNVMATKELLVWFYKNKKCKVDYLDHYGHYSEKDFIIGKD